VAVSIPLDFSKGVVWAVPRNGPTNKQIYRSFLIGLKIKKASHYGMPLIKKIYKTALFGGS
jgi:hypothetical protein